MLQELHMLLFETRTNLGHVNLARQLKLGSVAGNLPHPNPRGWGWGC